MKRRYVNTGGTCDHCRDGWRLFFCPLHLGQDCGICRGCAQAADVGGVRRVGGAAALALLPPLPPDAPAT